MILINKNTITRTGTIIIRQISNFVDDLGEGLLETKKHFFSHHQQNNKHKPTKSLKIAILGLPNAGKSTLINHLTGRPLCATSSKIHTTRNKAAAIYSTDDTQLIFIDTPGLVKKSEIKKFKLEDTFKNDATKSIEEANVIGIIQDMSNAITRLYINDKVLDVLNMTKAEIKTVLILNKVDTLKNKKLLLEAVDKLTSKDSWPHFADVFMISALTGDGVDDLRNYFLDSAIHKQWDYDKNILTDQPPDVVIQKIVKATVLEDLPQELPYLVNVAVDHIEYLGDDSINAVINLYCPSVRISRLIIGRNGERIKAIAKKAEQIICTAYQTNVRLKIVLPIKQEHKSLQKRAH